MAKAKTRECKVETCEFNGKIHEFPPFRVWKHRRSYFVVGPKGLVKPKDFPSHGFSMVEDEAERLAASMNREVGHKHGFSMVEDEAERLAASMNREVGYK